MPVLVPRYTPSRRDDVEIKLDDDAGMTYDDAHGETDIAELPRPAFAWSWHLGAGSIGWAPAALGRPGHRADRRRQEHRLRPGARRLRRSEEHGRGADQREEGPQQDRADQAGRDPLGHLHARGEEAARRPDAGPRSPVKLELGRSAALGHRAPEADAAGRRGASGDAERSGRPRERRHQRARGGAGERLQKASPTSRRARSSPRRAASATSTKSSGRRASSGSCRSRPRARARRKSRARMRPR